VKALVTRKIGMTSTISENGAVKAVTLLSAEPNVITQLKTPESDEYTSVQLGMGVSKKLTKPATGHLKKSKASSKFIREFRIDNLPEEFTVGHTLEADVFKVGDSVQAQGISKGKGWAGTIKRHNFHRQRKTHGGKGNTRQPGSIGSMYPQKIFKGKRMAGQMGAETVTVKNLKVALIDTEKNLIGVFGAVPGPRKGIVLLQENKR
jgi:large subunit ribosomal protein L3